MADELAELQKEFRQSVLSSLSEIKAGQRLIEKDLQELKGRSVDSVKFEALVERVDSLETAKTKLVTALVVIQGIFIILWTVTTEVFKK